MRRIFVTALVAGTAAGLLGFAIQAAALFPMIDRAELLENAIAPDGGSLSYAALADLLVGIGYGLLVTGSMALAERQGTAIDLRRGLLWGGAGFLAFGLAPALGLPPALPGSEATALAARQSWWIGTALATAGGLAALVFAKGRLWRIAGIILIVAPHALGAPRLVASASVGIFSSFALLSLAVAAVFWLVLGSGCGFLYGRLGVAAPAYAARPAAPR